MGEILKSWFRSRLGVIMDLRPEIFGHYTRDGRLLAQILHSYDIITRDQLDTIARTQDPALCRLNLKQLRVWLRFLGVDCEAHCIEEISRGKGATGLRLFYKVYLCLENKDRLHFITLQKERERYVPSSAKFEVRTVREDSPVYQASECPFSLSKKLVTGKETIEWHRTKFSAILRGCKQERKKFQVSCSTKPSPPTPTPTPTPITQRHVAQLSPELAVNDTEYSVRETQPTSVPSNRPYTGNGTGKPRRTSPNHGTLSAESARLANLYAESLKTRTKRASDFILLKSKMQRALLSEFWANLESNQGKMFDRMLASCILNQSTFEKRIVSRLCQVRNQKNIIAENRKVIQQLLLKTKEQERGMEYEREKDLAARYSDELETEYRRMCQLRCRIRDQKIRKLRERHERECASILDNLIEVAVKASTYSRMNDGYIPKHVWAYWMLLLRENVLSMREVSIEQMEPDEIKNEKEKQEEAEEEEEEEEEELDGLEELEEEDLEETETEKERREIIRDAMFEDYHRLYSPWNEFAPPLTEDVKEILRDGGRVLGHIVYRLLEAVHPASGKQGVPPFPRPNIVAVLVGVDNSIVRFPSIQSALDEAGIRVIRMEEALNYCLARYKAEASDFEYIDSKIVAITANTIKRLESMAENNEDHRQQRYKKEERGPASRDFSKRGEPASRGLPENQAESPETIPDDDSAVTISTTLTETGRVGKWLHEFLTVGQPITDELATMAVIAYLKNLSNADAWALLDYPDSYEQLALLESSWSLWRETPETVGPEGADREDIGTKQADPASPRIEFRTDQEDAFSLNLYSERRSRLVPRPCPSAKQRSDPSETFATICVRLSPNLNVPGGTDREVVYEMVPVDSPPVVQFYANRGKAYVFYYSRLDWPTLTELAQLILTSSSVEITAESTIDTDDTDRKKETQVEAEEEPAAVVRRLLTRPPSTDDWLEGNNAGITRKPGQTNWEWIEFPIPSALLETLASLWQAIETVYVEEVKTILSVKAAHANSVVPHRDSLLRNARKFINRPDNKQPLVNEFVEAFNAPDLDEDRIRQDVDVKCELYRRVAHLQSVLWEMCDDRKEEAEQERLSLAQNRWTTLQATILSNVYVGMLQSEMDRCIDTIRLIHDYYAAMLPSSIGEFPVSKPLLARLEPEEPRSLDFEGEPNIIIIPPKTVDNLAPILDQDELQQQIVKLLIDPSESYDPAETFLYKTAILDNVHYVRTVVASLETRIEEVRKKAAARFNEKVIEPAIKGDSMFLEWRYAVLYEVNRVRHRLDILTEAAKFDLDFLIGTIRNTFRQIHDCIVERYESEVKAVNDATNLFCLAIEKASPIEEKIVLLHGNRCIVIPGSSDDQRPMTRKSETGHLSPLRFHIKQLARLFDIFRQVAPRGEMPERAFLYILQDLHANQLDHQANPNGILPYSWAQLGPADLGTLIEGLFGTGQQYIDWREFLVYAMDLPLPNSQQLLRTRKKFRCYDQTLTETVTRDQYYRTPLWFYEETTITADIANFQRRNSSMELCVEDVPILPSTSEETVRLGLAKELLCLMFLTDQDTVNYTALLLSFCKDPDPTEGFARALELAIGKSVCTDVEQGERYLEGLRFQMSIDDPADFNAIQVAKEAANHLINDVKGSIEKREPRESSPLAVRRLVVIESLDAESDRLRTDEPATFPRENNASFESSQNSGETSPTIGTLPDIEYGKGIDPFGESLVYWIPRETCLTVLAAAVPSLLIQPNLFYTCNNLPEEITHVYEQLRETDLVESRDAVLAHRLLNHDFIRKLLENTSKFTDKRIGNLVEEIIGSRKRG